MCESMQVKTTKGCGGDDGKACGQGMVIQLNEKWGKYKCERNGIIILIKQNRYFFFKKDTFWRSISFIESKQTLPNNREDIFYASVIEHS